MDKSAIAPINDASVVGNAIAPVTVDEDAPDTIIDLSNVFTDVDGDAIALSVFSNTNTGLVSLHALKLPVEIGVRG